MNTWQDKIRQGGLAVGFTPQVERFLFLRHGQTDHNLNKIVMGWADIPLNLMGEGQALEAAAALVGQGITDIVTSSLARAWRTAEIVSARINRPISRVDTRLRERCYGEYENLPEPTPTVGSREDKGVELPERFGARSIAGVNDALKAGCPLIVAHGGTRSSLLYTLGLALPEGADQNAVPLEFLRTASGWQIHALR